MTKPIDFTKLAKKLEPGEIIHHFSSGVYAKETHIPMGHVLVQHTHKFSHLSILAVGTVELMVDGIKSTISAPACITMQEGRHHGVKALTDVVWYCAHATDCTNIDKIDEVLIAPANNAAVNQILQTLGKEH